MNQIHIGNCKFDQLFFDLFLLKNDNKYEIKFIYHIFFSYLFYSNFLCYLLQECLFKSFAADYLSFCLLSEQHMCKVSICKTYKVEKNNCFFSSCLIFKRKCCFLSFLIIFFCTGKNIAKAKKK